MKPVIRVKALTRMYGGGVPDDAQPGDLVVGNRGAAAVVKQAAGTLYLEYAGNYNQGARPAEGRRVYDFR